MISLGSLAPRYSAATRAFERVKSCVQGMAVVLTLPITQTEGPCDAAIIIPSRWPAKYAACSCALAVDLLTQPDTSAASNSGPMTNTFMFFESKNNAIRRLFLRLSGKDSTTGWDFLQNFHAMRDGFGNESQAFDRTAGFAGQAENEGFFDDHGQVARKNGVLRDFHGLHSHDFTETRQNAG